MPTENRSSNTEMVSELLPCPFCGQQDFLIERLDSDASVVICQGLTGPHEACLARGPVGIAQDEGEEQPGRDKAVELWNARAEQHQCEPAACAHQWTDDGEFLLVCTECGAQENHAPGWRDMASAPRDGTMLRLLVRFEEHSTEDDEDAPTIGANNFDNDGEDRWQFAGWCWSHDHFVDGKGEPIGWLPMFDEPMRTDPGEVERLRDALDECDGDRWKLRTERVTLCAQLAELLAAVSAHREALKPLGLPLGDRLEEAVLSASAEPSAPKCETCQDQGEVYSGKMADQGYHQPPEPIMDACPDCKWSASVERDERADAGELTEALRTCEKWFVKHSPTAPLIGGLGDAEHPMLTCIRAALERKP